MEKTTVNAELVIHGDDFNPNIISNILGLQTESKWRKGDLNERKTMIRDHSSWSFEVGLEESYDISEQYMKLYEIICEKKEDILRVLKQLNAQILLLITIFVYDECTPIISFNKDIIGLSNEMNAGIDIDMYFYGNE